MIYAEHKGRECTNDVEHSALARKKGFKSVRYGNNGTRDCEVLVEHPGLENKGTREVKVLVCQHVS